MTASTSELVRRQECLYVSRNHTRRRLHAARKAWIRKALRGTGWAAGLRSEAACAGATC